MIVYFDDILIYSQTRESHLDHLRQVCQVLRTESLYANLKKCNFMTNRIIFLGYVVTPEELLVDPEKVHAITEWPLP